MKLVLFDNNHLGVVRDDEETVVDVTTAVPSFDPDPLTAGWWRTLCRDWDSLAEQIKAAAASRQAVPISSVTLRAPVLSPSKIIAVASNYQAHVAEMHEVQERTLGEVHAWMMNFDIFLKAPSSIADPDGPVVLPPAVLNEGQEVHHESELVLVIGKGGKDIPEEEALNHLFGCTVGLDITVRSQADRSRRKSYDTFSPMGPYLRVVDENFSPDALDIRLTVGDDLRQDVNTRDLITSVPQIISYASSVMTLNPGDVIFTGAPPGVGPIASGEELVTSISGIGTMRTTVA